MQRRLRQFTMGASLLASSLVLSSVGIAQDRHEEQQHHEQQDRRYYDRTAKNYRQWNSDEDRRFHEYLRERHLKDRDFEKLNNRDRDAYFKWRHDHDGHR